MVKYTDVDGYLDQLGDWQEEMIILRNIVRESGLTETIKWGIPCYTSEKENVFGIAAFKNWVCVWFYQGSILEDNNHYLINAQEGKTKSLRQWRFTSKEEILKAPILEYVLESIENSRNGIKSQQSKVKKVLVIPTELQELLSKDKVFKSKWDLLSLSCQREYAEYIIEAKRGVTKVSRMAKIVPMIMYGKGIHDAYKK